MMIDLQALLDAHQSTRLLRLSFPQNDGPQAKLMVNRFIGTEYLSRDFAFNVELLSDDGRIELESMHGKLLCVSLVLADGTLRPFTGYVTSFKLVKTDGSVAFDEVMLIPWRPTHDCARTTACSVRNACASKWRRFAPVTVVDAQPRRRR
jgi:type VI secretion system secreted protein VgrG